MVLEDYVDWVITPLQSSFLAQVGYSAQGSVMVVSIVNQNDPMPKHYAYSGVGSDIYNGFINADSKGSYFSQHIANLPNTRLDDISAMTVDPEIAAVRQALASGTLTVSHNPKLAWWSTICERCSGDVTSLRMSMFDTSMCYTQCLDKEKAHPDYGRACEIERQHVTAGDTNFAGVGLPIDYPEFLEEAD